MWSISVSSEPTVSPASAETSSSLSSPCGFRTDSGLMSISSVPAEQGDAVLADLLAEGRVVDARALLGSQAQDTDLPLVQVLVHRVRGLADVLERVDGREDRLDLALADQPVRVPGLAVVGEVRADDALELHPEVPVVVLDHVA